MADFAAAMREREREKRSAARREAAFRTNYSGPIATEGTSTSPLGDIATALLERLGMGGQKAYDIGQTVEAGAELTPYGAIKQAGGGDITGALENLVGGPGGGAVQAIFAGPAARTADRAALAMAKSMSTEGADRRAIWDATGWFQGPDKQWRFEIPDQQATFSEEAFPRGVGMQGFMDEYAQQNHGVDRALQLPPNSPERKAAIDYASQRAEALRTKPVGEVVGHDDLFAAYPEVADIPIGRERNSNLGFKGSFSGGEIGVAENNRDKLSTTIHELQHAVQEKEGFAPGGNTMSVFGHSDPVVRKAAQDEMDRLLKPHSYEQYAKLVGAGWPEATEEQLKASYRDYMKTNRKARSNVYDPANKAAQQTAAERVYQRTAGEVEARNAQARQHMTPEERRAKPPWETQDIPDEDQIVRARNDLAEAMASKDPDWFPSILAKGKTDPELWHPLGGGVKLTTPFSELTSQAVPTGPMLPDKPISPEELAKQGGYLMALYGDRSKAGQTLLSVNGQPLTTPVKLGGGGRFMQENPGDIWASEQGRITTLADRVRALEERSGGKPVFGVHAAMGPESGDFAKMTTRPLLDLAKNAPITKKAAKEFDVALREKGVTGWPGIKNAGDEWLETAPGSHRTALAKLMQLSQYQTQGFPNVAAVRKAMTEEELHNAPLLTTGMSVGKFEPGGQIDYSPANPHDTYKTNIRGTHEGNLGLLPFEVVFHDFMKTRPAAEQPVPGRQLQPTTARTVETAGATQELNDEWLDTVMPWWTRLQR